MIFQQVLVDDIEFKALYCRITLTLWYRLLQLAILYTKVINYNFSPNYLLL
jgi:hypothetical protein